MNLAARAARSDLVSLQTQSIDLFEAGRFQAQKSQMLAHTGDSIAKALLIGNEFG